MFTCAICLEETAEQVDCCKQGLHKRCLYEWLESGGTSCPLCRAHKRKQVTHFPIDTANGTMYWVDGQYMYWSGYDYTLEPPRRRQRIIQGERS